MSDRLFADCCYGTDHQHSEQQPCPHEIAARLTPSQRALLEDICRCPGLFAGQYVHDGAGIEHLPRELWWQSFGGWAQQMLGLGNAHPSDLGLVVNELAMERLS